jgi:hypothetical protein
VVSGCRFYGQQQDIKEGSMNKIFLAALVAWMISPNIFFTNIDLQNGMLQLEGERQWK